MAIGTTAAILGSAVIGAASSAIAGSSNSKAIGQASDAQAKATREATAAQERARAQNVQLQQPFYNTGTAAMGQINALLGLSTGAPAGQAPVGGTVPAATMPSGGGVNGSMIMGDEPGYRSSTLAPGVQTMLQGKAGFVGGLFRSINNDDPAQSPSQQMPGSVPIGGTGINPSAPTLGGTTQQSANAAYDQFKNYTGYQTRLNEGNNSLNAGYAAAGTLQSGDAMKSFARFNQDYAANEFGQYMNLLGGQQQLGSGAANALSGVNTNYANAASNLAIQSGQNIANTAVARANNTSGMIQGIGGALMNGIGAASSYHSAPAAGAYQFGQNSIFTPGFGG